MPSAPTIRVLLLFGVSAALWTTGGCGGETRTVGGGGTRKSNAERTQTLLAAVTNQLSDLPDQSILDLSPPAVLVDASQSTDGKDIEAELVPSSTSGQPIYNVLNVPARNARFKGVGVRAGDVVKWYANQQSELENEFGGRKGLSPGQIRQIQKLPAEQQEAVANSMVRELQDMQGDIVSVTAFEFPVAQVLDTNRLMVDLSGLSDEERGRLPIEYPFRLEVLRYNDTRFSELQLDLSRYARRGVPLLGWEPSPDRQAVEQIVERLNQWLRQSNAELSWATPVLLETLPEDLRSDAGLKLLASPEALARPAFSLPNEQLRATQAQAYEGRLLEEATWMRDIGGWATRDARNQVERIDSLFDWTIRNVQLDNATIGTPPYRPWQCLAYGHASAEGRAWVFAQLCRQQDVPMVVVRPGGEEGPLWCGAWVDGQLYLYDPELGLPLEQREGHTATLAEVRESPELLAQFDLDEPYFEGDLSDLRLRIVAGPFALSRRAAMLTERLTGNDMLLLNVAADELAETFSGIEGVGEVTLWEYPYRATADQLAASRVSRTRVALEFEPFVHKPRLWKARLLTLRGAEGKTVDASRGNLETTMNDHRDAGRLYLDDAVRPTDRAIQRLESEETRRAWRAAKENATYWQGLLSYDRGDYTTAGNWLEKAEASERWRPGATYNRARALEAAGDTQAAIELLESGEGPQSRGNRLRAKRLASRADAAEGE